MTLNFIRHSPSSCNLFAASPAMFVLEKILGIRQPVGAPVHRGTAVEDGIAAGLKEPHKPLSECQEIAVLKYDTLMALNHDKRRDEYRETIPAMVERGLGELRPYGIPSRMQGFIEWKPEGLRYPVVGYFDFEWEQHGIIVDLKTTEKLPGAIKIPHARQVGLYASSDNMDARVTYCTPKKIVTYKLENVREHRNALHQIALRVERFLSLSDDPEFFTSITAPDYESFYWGGQARQIGFDHWKF